MELGGAAVAGALLAWLLPAGDLGYALLAVVSLTLLLAALAAASAESRALARLGTQFVLFLVLGTNRPGALIADAKALRLFLLAAAAAGGLVLGVFLLPLA